MDNPKYADKSELLYRRISSNKFNNKTPPQYIVEISGKIRITSSAFLGGERPSVDRAKLTGFKPESTRKRGKPTDGVISIATEAVETIELRHYTGAVKIKPEPDNDAHAEIVLIPKPDRMTKSLLSDLRDALARKATCIVKPDPLL